MLILTKLKMKKIFLILFVLPMIGWAQTSATDLFISEYAEGSGYNKYIEIYNGTGSTVDLSNYEIWKISNGGAWPEYTLSLSGLLADNDVYIVCSSISSVDTAINNVADTTWSQCNFNGDDAMGLAKNSVLIDAVGTYGPDPGAGWDVAGVTDATKDHTLVRKCSVSQGDTSWTSSAGVDSLSSQWLVYPQNYWLDIDQHSSACGCTDSLAANYNPIATTDDGSCVYCQFSTIDSISVSSACPGDTIIIYGDSLCVPMRVHLQGWTIPDSMVIASTSSHVEWIVPLISSQVSVVNLRYIDNGTSYYTNMLSFSYTTPGCTDIIATNYDSTAVCDDGSCTYPLSSSLFISEYAEGSGYNKYIELYNRTGAAVDLSEYALWKIINGGTWPEYILSLSGVLADNDVYIICSSNSNIDTTITNIADTMVSFANWSGDDAVGLARNGMLIDAIGSSGPDPGAGWDVAGVTAATKDHTLIRKCSVSQGDTSWTASAGIDSLTSQWLVYPQNYWLDINQHTSFCGCMDSLACNYDPSATSSDGSCIYLTPIVNSTNVSCNGSFDGSIIATATGGVLPFQYSLGAGLSQSNGNFYNLSPGQYYIDVTDANGCAANQMVTITEPLPIVVNDTLNGCDSILIGNYYYNASGDYTDTLNSVNGCDSVVNMNLTIEQNTFSYDTIAANDVILWNGITLNVSGDYTATLINAVGCDSIINLNLTITNTTNIINITDQPRSLFKITDFLGQETPYRRNTPLLYIYDDGTVEKRIVIE